MVVFGGDGDFSRGEAGRSEGPHNENENGGGGGGGAGERRRKGVGDAGDPFGVTIAVSEWEEIENRGGVAVSGAGAVTGRDAGLAPAEGGRSVSGAGTEGGGEGEGLFKL